MKPQIIISKDIPAGNIRVLSVNDREVDLDVELRDTNIDWFYWCFKAVFPEPGNYVFRFASPNKIGTQGPAFSLDGGATWKWLGADSEKNAREFLFTHEGGAGAVMFCMGLQYLQRHFDAFRREFSSNPLLCVDTLCASPKGRRVELAVVREGAPQHAMLLTARHHANEMMASHVLEGVFRSVLADTDFARRFRSEISLYAVPFVDKDGVEDGDQGKSRTPHDHNRDYSGTSIYPECGAIRELIDRIKPMFLLDMHCPWIRGGCNEQIYFPGSESPRMTREMDVFSKIMEDEATPEAPFSAVHNIPFGTSWNTAAAYAQGKGMKMYADGCEFIRCALTIEIPFANFGHVPADRATALVLGNNIAHALLHYACGGGCADPRATY